MSPVNRLVSPTPVGNGAAEARRRLGRISAPAWAWWTSALVWLAFGWLAPIAWTTDFVATLGRLSGLLAFAIIQLSAWMVARLILLARPRYMSYCFWLFVYVWFGLAALLQVDDGRFARRMSYLGVPYSEETFALALGIVLTGCLAYLIGQALYRGRLAPTRGRQRTIITMKRLRVITVLGLITGLILLIQAGDTAFTTRGEFARFESSPLTKVLRATALVGAYLAVYAFRHKRVFDWRRIPVGWRATHVVTAIVALVVSNPLVVQRALSATVFGGLLFAWIAPTRKQITMAFLAIPTAILIVYPALTMFRSPDVDVSYSDRIEEGIYQPLRSAAGDFGMFTQVAEGVEYVEANGYTGGRHLVASFFVFVPRSFWTNKAFDIGDTVHSANGYPERFNYSSPMWMEFYVEGGWILLIGGFVAWGWLSRAMDSQIGRFPSSRMGLMVPVIACYQFYFLRGSSLASAPMAWALIGVLFIACRSIPAPLRAQRGADCEARPSIRSEHPSERATSGDHPDRAQAP